MPTCTKNLSQTTDVQANIVSADARARQVSCLDSDTLRLITSHVSTFNCPPLTRGRGLGSHTFNNLVNSTSTSSTNTTSAHIMSHRPDTALAHLGNDREHPIVIDGQNDAANGTLQISAMCASQPVSLTAAAVTNIIRMIQLPQSSAWPTRTRMAAATAHQLVKQ